MTFEKVDAKKRKQKIKIKKINQLKHAFVTRFPNVPKCFFGELKTEKKRAGIKIQYFFDIIRTPAVKEKAELVRPFGGIFSAQLRH